MLLTLDQIAAHLTDQCEGFNVTETLAAIFDVCDANDLTDAQCDELIEKV